MSRKLPYRVRLHRWIEGVLHYEDHLFEDLGTAMHFSEHRQSHHSKVYDNNRVIHQTGSIPTDTYSIYA
jgi:hypothetical protein